jgi:hypothetical protein
MFDPELWREHQAKLAPDHRRIASTVYDHAIKALASRPHHRVSSRRRGDGQTILRTNRNHYWLAIDCRTEILRLRFPDWKNHLSPPAPFHAETTQSSATKQEKCVALPGKTSNADVRRLLAFLNRVHAEAVAHYGD